MRDLNRMDERYRQEFERLGVDHIRWLVNSGRIRAHWIDEAVGWLAIQDAEERSRREASQASQDLTALSAKRAAWIAAIAAIIAAVLTIISIVIAALPYIS